MVENEFWDAEDDSTSSMDSFISGNNTCPPSTTQKIMTLVGKHWRGKLGNRHVNDGVFVKIPNRVELEKNILQSLTMEWVGVAKDLQLFIRKNICSA